MQIECVLYDVQYIKILETAYSLHMVIEKYVVQHLITKFNINIFKNMLNKP